MSARALELRTTMSLARLLRDDRALGSNLAAVALPGMSALAQTPAPSTQASAAPTEPLQEIIVTGSRIAAPNEVSTSPINVISSKDIQVYGRTDISDIVNLLPQNFNNALSQDYGNGTSGLSTAAGVATA